MYGGTLKPFRDRAGRRILFYAGDHEDSKTLFAPSSKGLVRARRSGLLQMVV